MSSDAAGLIDTNIFVHAQANDRHTAECSGFISALQSGQVLAALEPIVLHELSYVLPRLLPHMGRLDIARYLLMVLDWPGVVAEKDVLRDTVQRWERTPGLGFADAYLAAVAAERGSPVYTKNVRDLIGQDVDVPDPLPSLSM